MRRRLLDPVVALLGVLALGVAMVPSPAAAAPARDPWGNPPYYDYSEDGFFFYLPTNAETFTATRVTGVQTGFEDDYRTSEQHVEGLLAEAVWNEDCPAVHQQKITQSRQVVLSGPPGLMFVNLQMSNVSPASHKNKNPIAWAEVRLNKTVIARVERDDAEMNEWVPLDVTEWAHLVKPGSNTISVVALKGRTKKSWGYCSYESIPSFGVAVELLGVPESGMRSSLLLGSFEGNVLDTTATITNDGPSWVFEGQGTFNLTTNAETNANTDVLILGSDLASCSDAVSTGDGWSASCELPDMAPGSSLTVDVHIEFTRGFCPFSIPLWYRVSANWRDPNPSDNGESNRAITC